MKIVPNQLNTLSKLNKQQVKKGNKKQAVTIMHIDFSINVLSDGLSQSNWAFCQNLGFDHHPTKQAQNVIFLCKTYFSY